MKFNFLTGILFIVAILFYTSCDIIDDKGIDGSQSPIGEIGNRIELGTIEGVSNPQIVVSDLDNGISTFTCSATATNENYLDLLDLVPNNLIPGTVTVSGNKVMADINIKVTDKGGQLIFNDGSKLTLVNYDAKVGDKYAVTIGNTKMENEVIEKSSEDDYFWGGMQIKVVKVKAKSVVPGVSNVILVYNHKFGLVGAEVNFEDGSVKKFSVFC